VPKGQPKGGKTKIRALKRDLFWPIRKPNLFRGGGTGGKKGAVVGGEEQNTPKAHMHKVGIRGGEKTNNGKGGKKSRDKKGG